MRAARESLRLYGRECQSPIEIGALLLCVCGNLRCFSRQQLNCLHMQLCLKSPCKTGAVEKVVVKPKWRASPLILRPSSACKQQGSDWAATVSPRFWSRFQARSGRLALTALAHWTIFRNSCLVLSTHAPTTQGQADTSKQQLCSVAIAADHMRSWHHAGSFTIVVHVSICNHGPILLILLDQHLQLARFWDPTSLMRPSALVSLRDLQLVAAIA